MNALAAGLYVLAYLSAVIDGTRQGTGLYPKTTPAGWGCGATCPNIRGSPSAPSPGSSGRSSPSLDGSARHPQNLPARFRVRMPK